jgi:hypothetical protein
MLVSIHAASRGLISNNLPLGIATDGLIHRMEGIGDRKKYAPVSWKYEKTEVSFREQILREDVELLEIISTILPYL